MDTSSSLGGKLLNYWNKTNFQILKNAGIISAATTGITSAIGLILSSLKSDIILFNSETSKNQKTIENCPTIKKGKFYHTFFLPTPFS